MDSLASLEAERVARRLGMVAINKGASRVTLVDPKQQVVVGEWVRLKCTSGCDMCNTSWTCPPVANFSMPAVEFFSQYRLGLMLKFTSNRIHVDKPDYIQFKNRTKAIAAGIEHMAARAGMGRAMAFHSGPCTLCWRPGSKKGSMVYEKCTLMDHQGYASPYLKIGITPTTPVTLTADMGSEWTSELEKKDCRWPTVARPAMEAMKVDVFATLVNIGWNPIVYTSRTQIPSYYSFVVLQ